MKREAILETLKQLSTSVGFYERLYYGILLMEQEEPEKYEGIMNQLEELQLNDSVDLILYLEG